MEEILKKLKNVRPEKDYTGHSLRLILASPQNPRKRMSAGIMELLKFGAALGLTGMLIVISSTEIFPSLNARLLSPVLLSNLDEQKIQNEANQLDIKITVAEARYYNDSVKKVAAALDETSKNSPAHLNSTILEKELEGLDINSGSNEDINDLLNKLTM